MINELICTERIAPELCIASADIARQRFDLGWDFAGYCGIHLPEDASCEMQQGWKEARRRIKPRMPTRYERKWLSLRHNALRRGRIVDSGVTPDLLQKISTGICPVTLEKLTCATGGDLDWSVDRINNDGAYAIGNIAILSVRANVAKGSRSIDDVVALAGRLAGTNERYQGLNWVEWARISTLMTGPDRLANGTTYLLPHCAMTPPGLAGTPVQTLQDTILSDAIGTSRVSVLGRLRGMGGAGAEKKLHKLVQSIRHKYKRNRWPFDVWLEPGVFDRFVEWGNCADERLTELYRYVMDHNGHYYAAFDREQMRETWSLETKGYVPASQYGVS